VGELAARMGRGEPAFNMTQGLPVITDDGRLAGVVTQGDLLRALEKDPKGEMTVLEAGSNKPVVAYPDELSHDALVRMLGHNIGRLPVVSREDPNHIVGYFNRASLISAWSRQMHEESVREHGWLRSMWRNSSRAPVTKPDSSRS